MQAIKNNTNQYFNIYPINNCNRTISSKVQLNPSNVMYSSGINFNGKISKDSFVKIISEDPINKLKKFSVKEYLKLTEGEKNILREDFNKLQKYNPIHYQELIKIHNYVANVVKSGLDKRFGKDKYVVILIGRSLSSIGKSLEAKIGENNVVNIPLSSAFRFSPSSSSSCTKEIYKNMLDNIKNDKGLDNFIEFLESKKLTKKDIESSNKHYILMDYCASGLSLKGAEKLFKLDFVWGNKNKNIHAIDIIRYLQNVNKNYFNTYNEKFSPKSNNIIDRLEYLLLESEYKDYATITRSEKLEDTIKASKERFELDNIPRETKLVWFKLIDSAYNSEGQKCSIKKSGLQKLVENIINKKESIKTKLNISNKKELKLPEQKIELWNDELSQYESDLRDDINEISKILIKDESNELVNSHKYKDEINILRDTYNKLIKIYDNSCGFFDDSYIDSKSKLQYYKMRAQIQEIMDKINS